MQIINLDLQKKDGFNKAITARRGESGWQFGVRLFDGGLQYATTSGDKLAFKVTTPSGNYAKVDATYTNGMVTVTLNSQITSEAGYYRKAYIEITNGTKIRTTQDIIFFSLGNSDISAGQAHYYVSELDKLLKQLNDEFDEWLVEREQDYADLLNRVNQLANRITGLDTKLDDIIAQLQKFEINTRNVFDLSLMTQPESFTKSRYDGHTMDIKAWGLAAFDNKATIAMFEPNKTYHTEYFAEVLEISTTDKLYAAAAHGGMCLYSGKTGYPTVWIAEGVVGDFDNLQVGDKVKRSKTFTTPTELHNPDANYQILTYGRRDVNGVVDAVRFHNVMIQEGSMFTGYQTNENNTLTRFDERQYKKSIFVDPRLVGKLPPTAEPIEGKEITITYTPNGIALKNTTDRRLRVYWNASTLGLSAEQSKQAFELSMRLRSSSGLGILEFGFGNGDNLQISPTYSWEFYSGIVMAQSSTGFSIWLNPNQSIDIIELYMTPINTSTVTLTLPEGINIDAFVSRGYFKLRNALGTLPPEIASNTFFYLENRPLDSGSNVKQTLTVRTGANLGSADYTYTRQRVNGTWGVWQRLLTAVVDANQVVKAGVDLNDEKISGEFIYSNPTNAPKAGQTWYGNIQRYGGAFVMQTLYNVNGYDDMYVRKCANTTWQEWRKVAPELFSDGRVDTVAVDFNTLKETDTVVNTSATNSPDGAASTSWYTQIIRYGSSGNYVYQRATRISSVYQNTYERQLFNGTWTPWRLLDAPYIDQILGTESNANKITTTQNIQLEATTSANLPTSGSGVYYYLETIARADNYVTQRATLRGGDMRTYTRQSHNGVWSAWQLIPQYGGYLPTQNQGQDLSVFTTTGSFMIYAPTGAPMDGTYIWYIEVDAYNATSCKQRATVYGLSDQEWTRQRVNNVWTEWVKVLKDTNSLPRVEITDFKTGWGHYSGSSRLTVRKVNGMVSLDGVFTNTVEMATGADGDERIVATLPEGYRPDTIITGMRMNGSGTTSWLLSIKPNGDICYSRHTDSGVSGWTGRQTVGKWFATHAVFPSA